MTANPLEGVGEARIRLRPPVLEAVAKIGPIRAIVPQHAQAGAPAVEFALPVLQQGRRRHHQMRARVTFNRLQSACANRVQGFSLSGKLEHMSAENNLSEQVP